MNAKTDYLNLVSRADSIRAVNHGKHLLNVNATFTHRLHPGAPSDPTTPPHISLPLVGFGRKCRVFRKYMLQAACPTLGKGTTQEVLAQSEGIGRLMHMYTVSAAVWGS